ncbi:MAG: branched-chain amino acid ABC transporter permease [Rhodospirillaceae bacterium]|nr:branched-chain amino acid ABC transporter permease [Rhodospirillaceae bacterium]
MDLLWLYAQALVDGLLAGVMYSLVALGFVLIFKASGVLNFAQGAMVFMAGLTFVSLMELGLHPALAGLATVAVMVALALAVERVVLRPLVNQPPIILFMATIGLTFIVEGATLSVWGSTPKLLELGDPYAAFEVGELYIVYSEFYAAIAVAALVIALALFFNKTRIGRALRAVADDHQAALSVGIPLTTIWVVVWSVAGVVALVAGIVWGGRLGVQFSLALLALKALPVLILGGFTSIPGAIVGGLLVGAGEKLAEVYMSETFGLGGVENFFPYLMAMLFLMVRPQGLFGERIIERV